MNSIQNWFHWKVDTFVDIVRHFSWSSCTVWNVCSAQIHTPSSFSTPAQLSASQLNIWGKWLYKKTSLEVLQCLEAGRPFMKRSDCILLFVSGPTK